jgi:hypothetical protein
VDGKRSDVQAVEGGRIGLGAVLFRFLSHCVFICLLWLYCSIG